LLNASLNVIQGIKGESLKLSILYGSHLMCELCVDLCVIVTL